MTKFVFRSLAREHPEPGEFLAFANEVAVGELAAEKFVTMAYLTIDPATGEVVAASAGHPQPRLVHPDGTVEALQVGGLALGIDSQQVYDEARAQLEPGSLIVLYTDGVVEARGADGEFWGLEHLDALSLRASRACRRRGRRADDRLVSRVRGRRPRRRLRDRRCQAHVAWSRCRPRPFRSAG